MSLHALPMAQLGARPAAVLRRAQLSAGCRRGALLVAQRPRPSRQAWRVAATGDAGGDGDKPSQPADEDKTKRIKEVEQNLKQLGIDRSTAKRCAPATRI